MRLNKKFFRILLNQLSDGIYFVDPDRTILYWNRGAERISGCLANEMIGKKCAEDLLNHIDAQGVKLCEGNCPMLQTLSDGREREAELYLQHRDGHRVPVLVQVLAIRDAKDRIAGAVQIFRDNSQKIMFQERIQRLEKATLFDPDTGLGNRKYFENHLKGKLEKLKRYAEPFGVLYLGIDGFEQLNAPGHRSKLDAVKMLGRILTHNTRPFDTLSYLGDGNFLALIDNVDETQLFSIAKKFCFLADHSSVLTQGSEVPVTISIAGRSADPEITMEKLLQSLENKLLEIQNNRGNQAVILRNKPKGDPFPAK
ncbi:MAG: PAS domain S-box protein [bacterium]|nr:PAS domain S-box protein [bacterium]